MRRMTIAALLVMAGAAQAAPHVTREEAGEILSHGRMQSKQTDINLAEPPEIRAPIGRLSVVRGPWWHAHRLAPVATDYFHVGLRSNRT